MDVDGRDRATCASHYYYCRRVQSRDAGNVHWLLLLCGLSYACASAGVPSQLLGTPRHAKAGSALTLFRTSTCAPRVYLTFLFFQDWSISSIQRNTSPGNPKCNSDDSVRASNPCSLLGQKHVTPPAKASPRRHNLKAYQSRHAQALP